jgi:TPR repeat protein
MRWNAAIAIACALLVCAALLLSWEYRRRPAEHINVLRARAAQGDAKAQFGLACAYYRGKGVPQDYAEALRWYKMAADQGEPDAEDGLGYMYVTGRGTRQDYAEALRWYKRAAEHGDAKGQFDLATVYNDGIGVPPDYVEASRWFRKAADQNYAKGQDGLGYMYYAGRGLPQDYAQAFLWYRKAAEHGYAKAEFDLSSMYYNGLGTSQDYAEARRWCIKAAKQGNADAQQALAVFGTEAGTVTKFEYLELVPSLLFGSLVLVSFFLSGRKHLDLRNAALLLLGLSLLAVSGMNLYTIAHGGLAYCTYPVAFRIVKRVLIGTAVLIIVTVVLPARKAPHAATTR